MTPTVLANEEIAQHMTELHPAWSVSSSGNTLVREFKTKGFQQALALTNLCGALAEEKNHHPDIRMGWGYCEISFTTHSKRALTSLDIECAKILDKLCNSLFTEIEGPNS